MCASRIVHRLITSSGGVTYETQKVRTSKEQDDIKAEHEQRARCHLNETIQSTILKGHRMVREVPHLNAKHRTRLG